ncbi:flavodoxin [uncultured Gilvimarinus sp.]|uniref:flavodoxin n=1 Tax=uncultured Gilvimarinus sp. TaxID=1689143 RepID=UPI0030ED2E16
MTDLSSANVGLIFGTDTGNTEEVGDKISTALASQGVVVEMLNVTDTSPEQIEEFDFIIMGIPTWDFGGIQDDWEDFEEQILATKLAGKTVALYGLGDQLGYGYYFVDAMGWLNERVLKAGATVIGHWSTEGYTYDESLAVNAERTEFCGLAIDDDQQFELTDERIERWVEQIVQEYQQASAA